MVKNRYILIIIMTILLFITGCSNQVIKDPKNTNILNYNFKILNLNDIDKVLSKKKYAYTIIPNKMYIAVISIHSHNASINQYFINNNDLIYLTIPKDNDFVISLEANSTITYTWNIANNVDNKVVQFERRSWIKIPPPKSERKSMGVSYDRQNFYFKPLKVGNEKVIMKYKNYKLKNNNSFNITFNINIK